jgi:hypothetical protein
MWDPQHFASLLASAACDGNSFTFTFFFLTSYTVLHVMVVTKGWGTYPAHILSSLWQKWICSMLLHVTSYQEECSRKHSQSWKHNTSFPNSPGDSTVLMPQSTSPSSTTIPPARNPVLPASMALPLPSPKSIWKKRSQQTDSELQIRSSDS